MRIIKFILNLLLSILCIFSLTIFSLSTTLKKHIDKDYVQSIIHDMDLSLILEQQNIEIVNTIGEVLKLVGVPEESIDAVVNSKPTKDFIGVYASNCITYLLYDEEILITKDDIKQLLENNFNIIEDSLADKEQLIFKYLKEMIIEYIDSHGDELAAKFPSPKEVLKNGDIEIYSGISLKDLSKKISFAISDKVIVSSIIVAIISLLSLIILNLSKRRWAKKLSIVFILYSLIILGIEFIIQTSKVLLIDDTDVNSKAIINIFNSFSNMISYSLFISIILSITLFIIYKLRKKEIITE